MLLEYLTIQNEINAISQVKEVQKQIDKLEERGVVWLTHITSQEQNVLAHIREEHKIEDVNAFTFVGSLVKNALTTCAILGTVPGLGVLSTLGARFTVGGVRGAFEQGVKELGGEEFRQRRKQLDELLQKGDGINGALGESIRENKKGY